MSFDITTKRLQLKPPVLENANELFELMNRYVDTQYLTWEPHKSVETTTHFINNLIEAQKHDRGYHWCVYNGNKIIGIVSLIDVKRQLRTWIINRAELSYWIAIPFCGNGYATEAAQAILDFGFNKLFLHKVIIAHAVENTESRRICGKLGFIKYALEHDAFMKNQKWYDLVWYELLKL